MRGDIGEQSVDHLGKRLGITRKIPEDIQVMIGSQWWCLRRRTVEWIIDFTKTRKDVRGSGAKPWRQKGTGRARAGTRKSPIWRGGGVTFGPKPRDYSFKLNRKVRQQAVAMAMSARYQEGNLVVLDDFTMEAIKTKEFVSIMEVLELNNALIVVDNENDELSKSSRNVPGYKVMKSDGVNVYDILLHEKLVVLQPAIEGLEERFTA